MELTCSLSGNLMTKSLIIEIIDENIASEVSEVDRHCTSIPHLACKACEIVAVNLDIFISKSSCITPGRTYTVYIGGFPSPRPIRTNKLNPGYGHMTCPFIISLR